MRSRLLMLVVVGVAGCFDSGHSSEEGQEYSGWATVSDESLEIHCDFTTFDLEVEVSVGSMVVKTTQLTEPLVASVYQYDGAAGVETPLNRGVPTTVVMDGDFPLLLLRFTLPNTGTSFTGTAVVTLSNSANPDDQITYTLEFSRPCVLPPAEPIEDFTTCCEGHGMSDVPADALPDTSDGSCAICGFGEQPPPIPGLPPPPPGPPMLGGVLCIHDKADGSLVTSVGLFSTGLCSVVLERPDGGHHLFIGCQSELLVTEFVPSNPDYLGGFLASQGTTPDMRKISPDEALIVNATAQTVVLVGYDAAGLLTDLSSAMVPNAVSADHVPGGGYFVLAGTPTLKLYYGETLDTAAMQPEADCGARAAIVRCHEDCVSVTNHDDDTCYWWPLGMDKKLKSATPVVIPTGDGPAIQDLAMLPDGSTFLVIPNRGGDSVTGAVLKDGEPPQIRTVDLPPGSRPTQAKIHPTTFSIDILCEGSRKVVKIDAHDLTSD